MNFLSTKYGTRMGLFKLALCFRTHLWRFGANPCWKSLLFKGFSQEFLHRSSKNHDFSIFFFCKYRINDFLFRFKTSGACFSTSIEAWIMVKGVRKIQFRPKVDFLKIDFLPWGPSENSPNPYKKVRNLTGVSKQR